MAPEFLYRQPVVIRFGWGKIAELGEVLKEQGADRCLVVCDRFLRDKVETLGYLFYVSDKERAKPHLPYIDEADSADPWFRMRRSKMLTPDAIVSQAQCLHEKYGFHNFKLKGGVLAGSDEMQAVRALKKTFPGGRVNIDPNGAWSLQEAIDLCKIHL